MREDFLRKHKEFFNVIVPFGSVMDAFSYETINIDVLEKAAKRFKYRYDILYGAKFDAIENGNEEEYADEVWLKRRKVYLEETDAVKRKESEIKIWYQEEQDRSNVWHIYTKIALVNEDVTPESLQLDSNKQLLQNLSDCEHLRWNAKMELLGFEPATSEDIKKEDEKLKDKQRDPWRSLKLRRHECIVDCLTLHSNPVLAKTIPYDESAVKLSFEMKDDIELY